ncbi:MAG: hypothetical protein WC285_01755 [Candidatus Gracilibacteria bacterium]
MMYGFGGGGMWVPVAFGLHMFFMAVLLLGIIFLLIWAIRLMDKNQLRMWTKWLLVVGVVGCLLTAGGVFMGMKGIVKDWGFAQGKCFKENGERLKCPVAGDIEEVENVVSTEVVAPAK